MDEGIGSRRTSGAQGGDVVPFSEVRGDLVGAHATESQGVGMERACKLQLKQQIIEVLSLEEITPESIVDSEPLFGDGLGLDSIDALELTVLLDRTYGIRLSSPAEGKQVFASIDTMADYIQQHRTK